MRIVYVLTSLGMGGAEKIVLALGDALAKRGHTVALLVLRPTLAEEWLTKLDTIHLEMRKTPFSVLRGMQRGRDFLRSFRPEIVHSHGFHGNLIARVWRLMGTGPAPFATIHNVYEGGWARMTAYRVTDPLAALTTAVSEAAAERFVALKAVSKAKCVVVPNGIDTEEFAPDAERRVRMRCEMGVNEEFVWLTAGRLVPAKDYPNLLHAFAEVRPERSHARLWIAGEIVEPEAAKLKDLTGLLNLRDSVLWLGLRRDLPALLDAADGFVLGSAWEGMPLALGEAMAMRKPVVATDVGGVRELVGDEGAIVPAHAPHALAAAMLSIMRLREETRQAIGERARERIVTRFSMETRVQEWEDLYRNVLAGQT